MFNKKRITRLEDRVMAIESAMIRLLVKDIKASLKGAEKVIKKNKK